MRFIRILLIVVGIVSVTSLTSALAQDISVETIPAFGQVFGSKLSPDGQTLATYEFAVIHGTEVVEEYLPIRLIDLESGAERLAISDFTDYATDVAFTPDSTKLASYHSNGYIYLWDATDGSLLNTIPAIPGNSIIQFLPDGITLAVLINGPLSQILLWNTSTGYITDIFMPRYETYAQLQEVEFNRTGGPERYINIDVSPDGSTIAAVTWLGNIWLWDVASGEAAQVNRTETELPELNIRQVEFSASGKSLAYLDTDLQEIHIRPVKSSSEDMIIPTEEAVGFALSPDEQTVVWTDGIQLFVINVAQPDETTVVEVATDDNKARIPGAYLAFTPDSQRVVFSGFSAIGSGENQIAVITLPE